MKNNLVYTYNHSVIHNKTKFYFQGKTRTINYHVQVRQQVVHLTVEESHHWLDKRGCDEGDDTLYYCKGLWDPWSVFEKGVIFLVHQK